MTDSNDAARSSASGNNRKGGIGGCGSCCLGIFGLFAVLLAIGMFGPMLSDDTDAENALARAYNACSGQEDGVHQADDGAVNTFNIVAAECVANHLRAPASAWDEIRHAAPRGDIGTTSWGDHAAIVVADDRFQVVFVVD